MGVYRDIAQTPGVIRLVCAQLLARFPFGMLALAMLLHIELIYGNYTSAGIVLAASSIGQALSGPVASRLMGRWGMRTVLAVTTVVCAVTLSVIALVPMSLTLMILCSLMVGLTTPPVQPAVRTLYPKIVPGRLISGLYSMDASAQEIIWVLGPVIAVFVATQVSPAAGLMVAVGFMVVGGLWFILSPELARVVIPPSRRRFGAVLSSPTVVIATVVGFLFVASFTAIETGVVAIYGHESLSGGIVLAIFSVGSLLGGFLFAHRPLRPWSLVVRMAVVAGGTALCLILLEAWWLSTALFIAGLGIAPTFAGMSAMVSATVKFSETAEAFGWVVTGQLMGAAAGSAVAGIAIDVWGPRGAVVISVLYLILSCLAALSGIRHIPDLLGRDAKPMTDTIQIPTIQQ